MHSFWQWDRVIVQSLGIKWSGRHEIESKTIVKHMLRRTKGLWLWHGEKLQNNKELIWSTTNETQLVYLKQQTQRISYLWAIVTIWKAGDSALSIKTIKGPPSLLRRLSSWYCGQYMPYWCLCNSKELIVLLSV